MVSKKGNKNHIKPENGNDNNYSNYKQRAKKTVTTALTLKSNNKQEHLTGWSHKNNKNDNDKYHQNTTLKHNPGKKYFFFQSSFYGKRIKTKVFFF